MLCPIRKKKDRSAKEPNAFELNSIRNDPDKLATIRKRLSDVADKTGYTSSDVAPIFERLKLDPVYWRLQIQDFGRLFSNVAGKPKDVYEMRSLISKRRFYLKRVKPEPVQVK